jgi:HK97 family phage major capsid protein
MTIQEMRQRARAVAQRMVAMRDQYRERRDAGKTGDELRSEAERSEWSQLNAEYNDLLAKIEAEEQEARMVEEAAAAEQWLQRSTSEPNRRPTMDDQLPGQPGLTYGDLGLTSRDQSRAIEQRQRDMTLAFRAWAGFGAPDNLYSRSNDAVAQACERLKFSPETSELALRMSGTDDYRAMQRALRGVRHDQRDERIERMLADVERRTLSSGVGADGGYTVVPATVMRSIELAMISYSGMMQVADVMTTATGEDMSWPVGDDTSNEASYVGENAAVSTTSVDPSFESVVWRSHDLQSGFVRASFRLFRDSFLNLESIIGAMIGERFGRKLNTEFTTGAAKIRGLITRAPVGQTTAGASAITYADMLGLEHSIDPAHRAGMSFMFHDSVLEYLRGLLDGQNRPLWQSNLVGGAPDTFNGRPYTINQAMDSAVTTTKKTVVAGSLSYYKIRQVGNSVRLKRLAERFAEYDQTAFIGYMSVDGNLLRPNAAAACPVKVLQQA